MILIHTSQTDPSSAKNVAKSWGTKMIVIHLLKIIVTNVTKNIFPKNKWWILQTEINIRCTFWFRDVAKGQEVAGAIKGDTQVWIFQVKMSNLIEDSGRDSSWTMWPGFLELCQAVCSKNAWDRKQGRHFLSSALFFWHFSSARLISWSTVLELKTHQTGKLRMVLNINSVSTIFHTSSWLAYFYQVC